MYNIRIEKGRVNNMHKTYGNISAKELIKLLGDKGWMNALREEFKKDYFIRLFYFLKGEEAEGKTILPPLPDVFRAFSLTALDDVKVVILGQDPYPTLGDAHGLAFSVRKGVRIPRSLNNIYAELRSELKNHTLSLPETPPDSDTFFSDGNLEPWSRQGVLLLNTVLTVNEGEPNSHQQKGWEEFTDAAIRALVARKKPSVFILWGANAQKKKALIHSCLNEDDDMNADSRMTADNDIRGNLNTNGNYDIQENPGISGNSAAPSATDICILEAPHPSPLSARRGFFGSAPFSKTNAFLERQGLAPIDWITAKSQ